MVRRALAASLLLVLLAGCGEDDVASPRLQVGDVLPPLSVVDLKGRPLTLRPSPGKLLILNLWATWCAPCREELPSLQRLAAKLDPTRFELLLLSVDDDEHLVREFLIDRKVRLASLLDPGMSVADDILGIRVFPSTYFVSPDGRIVVLMEGAREWDSAEILAQIEAMHPVR
ncbi:MAG TPA: redoxin domain-containing protein [Chromatiales bacterium]|nr:redoxin domain-containing protein [Chromatiales bacterium]HEX22841.1 redoxin domain-containing protein [Chromatiales bacterium]